MARLSAAKGGKPVETGWQNSDELNILLLIRILNVCIHKIACIIPDKLIEIQVAPKHLY